MPSLRIIARGLFVNQEHAMNSILKSFESINNYEMIFEYFYDLQNMIEELKPDIIYIKSLVYLGIILLKIIKNSFSTSIEKQLEKITRKY